MLFKQQTCSNCQTACNFKVRSYCPFSSVRYCHHLSKQLGQMEPNLRKHLCKILYKAGRMPCPKGLKLPSLGVRPLTFHILIYSSETTDYLYKVSSVKKIFSSETVGQMEPNLAFFI